MSGATQRAEFFWIDDRVIPRIAWRPTGFGPWKPPDPLHAWIGAITDYSGGFEVLWGKAATPERIADAVRIHAGLVETSVGDLGAAVPEDLLLDVAGKVGQATALVSERFKSLSNEERTTGALFHGLDGTYSLDDWQVRITTQGYSSTGLSSKETKIGADLGIIIDILRGKERTVKALLLQAKRIDELPHDIMSIPDLSVQLGKMLEFTKESYAVVYTPHGVSVFAGGAPQRDIGLQHLVTDAIRCSRGDRAPKVVANAIEKDLVVEVVVSGPPEVST